MQRDELLRRLEELVPEIQASGDAEGTLLKFASEHNLAPAQLEALAQVYNNGKALTFYSKAASRGGTFKLVETEPLLDRYTDHKKQQKLGDKKTTEKCASESASVGKRFPHYSAVLDKQEELEKSASVMDELEKRSCGISKIYNEKKAAAEVVSMTDELIAERMDSIRNTLDDIRQELRFNKSAFTRLEEDANDLWEAGSVLPVFNTAANYLKSANCNVDDYRFTSAKSSDRAVATDSTGLLNKMASVQEDLDFIRASREFVAEFEKAAAGAVKDKPKKEKAPGKPDKGKPGEAPTPVPHSNPAPSPGGPGGPPPGGPSGIGDLDLDVDQSDYEDEEGPPSNFNHTPEEKKGPSTLDNLLKGMVDKKYKAPDIGAPFRWGQDMVNVVSGGKNRRQQIRDRAVGEDTGITSLQRLMVSDPILSQADPDELIEHYNTINSIAPDIAADPRKLMLPLRDAVQYGSIPMHTLKELLELNKLVQQNRGLSADNESSMYALKPRATKITSPARV